MAAQPPKRPPTRSKLQIGTQIDANPTKVSRHLSDLAAAVNRLESLPAAASPVDFTATKAGLAPASGGGTANYLRADGTWATPAGSGDVSHTRLISTTAPLAGGGDLSADRTLSVGTFDSTHSGVVGSSGGGTTNYLRADGTWASPPGIGDVVHTRLISTAAPLAGGGDLSADRTHSITTNGIDDTLIRQGVATSVIGRAANSTGNVADIQATADGQCVLRSASALVWAVPTFAMLGDGVDGALHFDGSTTLTLHDSTTLIPSSSIYTLARDIFALSITIDSGVVLKPNGFRVFCRGTCTVTGKITANGGNASAGTIGSAGGIAGYFNASLAAGAGNTGNNGTSGSIISAGAPQPYGSTSTVAAAAGANATNICCGGGGGGGDSLRTGGAGGNIGPTAANRGGADFFALLTGGAQSTVQATQTFVPAAGGGGGAGGGTTGVGGGGGGGGGYVAVLCRVLSGSGSIEASGGNGGNGTLGNGIGSGGGGGGGGGIIILGYLTNNSTVAKVVTGGTHGTKTGTQGVDGGDGHAGFVVAYNMSGDGT